MKTILFQGDSITDCGRIYDKKSKGIVCLFQKMAKKTPLGNGYPFLVSKELSAEAPDEYNFVNRGVGGNRILDVYARIVRDIIKVKPDCMSLLIGVNDVWHGFDFNNGTGIERFEKIYNILLEELKQELPEMKIIIIEPFILEGSATADREGQPGRYEKFRKEIEEAAAIAKKLAHKHGIKFVPLQEMFDEQAKKMPAANLLSDGVHPTQAGHELIKNEWIKAFKEL